MPCNVNTYRNFILYIIITGCIIEFVAIERIQMKLRKYIDSHPKPQRIDVRRRLAKACKVTEPCIRHYANGIRPVPARLFKKIVGECDGEVGFADLLP